jgi:hypothetical protein
MIILFSILLFSKSDCFLVLYCIVLYLLVHSDSFHDKGASESNLGRRIKTELWGFYLFTANFARELLRFLEFVAMFLVNLKTFRRKKMPQSCGKRFRPQDVVPAA